MNDKEWTPEEIRELRDLMGVSQREFGQMIWRLKPASAKVQVSEVENGHRGTTSSVKKMLDYIEAKQKSTTDDVMVMSIDHLSSRTRRWLNFLAERDDQCSEVYVSTVGYLIQVKERFGAHKGLKSMKEPLAFADQLGYDYVRFDQDGPIYNELSKYDKEHDRTRT